MNKTDTNVNDKEFLKHLETASLSNLILSISSSALIYMGLEPKMKDKKDLKMAGFNIDMLEVLKEKTKNNRTENESQLLDHCISDLKMNFIKVKE
ncbi:MAG: DUF1844 domain-containing protein [Bdellovibrionales bacterium]|nr:DUF1844 domain-containing protein [Bdellovibrionales bacterium]